MGSSCRGSSAEMMMGTGSGFGYMSSPSLLVMRALARSGLLMSVALLGALQW